MTNKFYINLKAQCFEDERDNFSEYSDKDSVEIISSDKKIQSAKSSEELDFKNALLNANNKNDTNEYESVIKKKNNLNKLLNQLKTTIETKSQDQKFESQGNLPDKKLIEGNKNLIVNLSSFIDMNNMQNRLNIGSLEHIDKNQTITMLKFDIFKLDFDVLREFKIYFPDNNVENVIKLIEIKKSKRKMNKKATISKSLSEKKKKTYRKTFFPPLGSKRNREKKQTRILGFIRKFL